MARSLSGTIGEPTKFAGDYIFDATALGNATSITSSAFEFGNCQSSLQLNILANTAISIADTKSLTVTLLTDSSATGNFATEKVLFTVTAATTPETWAIGDTIVKYVSTDEDLKYAKVKITTTADESSEKVDGYLTHIV